MEDGLIKAGWLALQDVCVNSIKEEMSSILPADSSLGGGMQGIKEGGVVHFHFWLLFPVNISPKRDSFLSHLCLFLVTNEQKA